MPIHDQQLVRRCLAGDREAFGTLYDRHAGRVFHLLKRLTANAAEAEDLTQDTFVAAFTALSGWRGEGALSTWLCGIAFRQYSAARRRHPLYLTESLDETTTSSPPEHDPLRYCTQLEAEQRLETALVNLPPVCREVFVLVRVEGLSYREAAEWLHVPVGTVQSRLWRATQLLQAELAVFLERDSPSLHSEASGPSRRQQAEVGKIKARGGKKDAL